MKKREQLVKQKDEQTRKYLSGRHLSSSFSLSLYNTKTFL